MDKKTKKRKLRVAKAGKEEFERVWAFVHAMEALYDGNGFFEADWHDWPDDDEDKKLMREIAKDMEYEYDEDDDMVVHEFIRRKWCKANRTGSFGRILFNCETLIDNCCDPELDYLEFKPSIMHAERIALEKVEKIILDGKKERQSADRILEAVMEMIDESKKDEED